MTLFLLTLDIWLEVYPNFSTLSLDEGEVASFSIKPFSLRKYIFFLGFNLLTWHLFFKFIQHLSSLLFFPAVFLLIFSPTFCFFFIQLSALHFLIHFCGGVFRIDLRYLWRNEDVNIKRLVLFGGFLDFCLRKSNKFILVIEKT